MTISGLRKDRQTPGVYVTEFPAFPPTLLGVRTAVPCFIGYTQKAEDPTSKKGLQFTPVPIDSMTAFATYFGAGKPLDSGFMVGLSTPPTQPPADPSAGPDFRAASAQLLADKKQINLAASLGCGVKRQSGATDGSTDSFCLYASLQMFYANGGGFCYVISVGNYDGGKKKDDLIKGLEQAHAVHDVTMLVIPDACLLPLDDYSAVVNAMLSQANALQDRVAILDLPGAIDTFSSAALKQAAASFYNAISSSQEAFSYGAAYAPAIRTSVFSPDDLDFQALADASKDAGGKPGTFNLALNHLLTSQAVSRCLSDPEKLSDALAKIAAAFPVPEGTTPVSADAVTAFVSSDGRELLADDALKKFLASVQGLATATLNLDSPASPAPAPDAAAGAAAATPPAAGEGAPADGAKEEAPKPDDTKPAAAPAGGSSGGSSTPLIGLCAVAAPAASDAKGAATAGPTPINRDNLNKYLINVTPLLSQILKVVCKQINVVPASGIMAGIWTKSDASNGVWNAPANMAINRAISPHVVLNDSEQGAYNLPPDGKAISIVRSFPGKGTVVWGARTLDGNSNDYRYIQVRRNLIYIEQSVKQAMRDFVFKENDAKTWTTVTSMISNFLTSHWQAGGLMGTKANEAFSVACGKPATMTDLDILNGYMIVSIAVSCIRPAEFIEITVTQAMQGS